MKGLKLSLIVLTATLLTIGLGGIAYAFHNGGVAECAGCHSMHSPNQNGSFLLKGSDQSSTCLNCHEVAGDTAPNGYHISTPGNEIRVDSPPKQRSPGGDFGWLKRSFTFPSHGATETEDGSSHGHSIKAADYSYTEETRNAPGGTFPGSQLGCQSCHDPHGKGRRLSDGNYATTGAPILNYGSYHNITEPAAGEAVGLYRILGYPGYKVDFGAWPIAFAPRSAYNRAEQTAALQVRVAYGSNNTNTWGNWCGTCHTDMHSGTGKKHPVDHELGDVAANYNSYVKTGDMTGTQATAFTSLVPFATRNASIATLKSLANPTTVLTGPATTDEVTCLSCHRAHASGWKHALRWDSEATFITSAGAYVAGSGRTALETEAAYYNRPASVFSTYQRNLCNKCHAKD